MRYKESIQNKLYNLESRIKKIGFYIKTKDNDTAYEGVDTLLELIEEIHSLLNLEEKDK